MDKRWLYIMISRTDSKMGRIIRTFTKYEYNHVSLTLDPEFRSWVSYARYYHDAPLYGGYIVESAERFLAGGNSVKIKVFRVEISEERYNQLREAFASAGSPESGMIYNTFDALATTWGRSVPVRNAYTCLGFAREVLGMDFRSIGELDSYFEESLVYEGELTDVAYDSGCREDRYFESCGLMHGMWYTLKNLTRLSYRAICG